MLEPQRISSAVAEELENPENELWLSPISIWELGVLHAKRRLNIVRDIEQWMDDAFRIRPFREAPVTFEVAREVRRLTLSHRDPADRLLVATAKVFELTLVTADERLLDIPGLSVLAG